MTSQRLWCVSIVFFLVYIINNKLNRPNQTRLISPSFRPKINPPSINLRRAPPPTANATTGGGGGDGDGGDCWKSDCFCSKFIPRKPWETGVLANFRLSFPWAGESWPHLPPRPPVWRLSIFRSVNVPGCQLFRLRCYMVLPCKFHFFSSFC